MVDQTFTAYWRNKRGNVLAMAQGSSRIEALDNLFLPHSACTECSSGYGYNGSLDIRWTKRAEWLAERREKAL